MMAESLIFVVDDDPLVTKNLAEELAEEWGCEVETFSSPRQVLEVMTAGLPTPDAVIAGLRMAELDGLALLEQLGRVDPELAFLLMTSVSDADATARAIAGVGPLCHVHKPCVMAELLPKLQNGLERRRLVRRVHAAEHALASRDAALVESTRRVEQAHAELQSTHTELRTATERLVQAEQLAAVGRVVSGIAHELSRQLALVGYAEAIKSRVAHDAELVEFADIIVTAQKRLAAMVDEIRDFAAAEAESSALRLECEPADVAAVIDEALGILRYDRDVREREIVRSYRARPLAALHRRKFAQVVINLVSNAVLATRPGDIIQIALDTTATTGQAGEPAGRAMAEIAVADGGAGMPPEVLARLGEPFFTTRGESGAGLGVGICMRIAEEHGGSLTFSSEIGRGTTARVLVPLIQSGPSGPSGEAGAHGSHGSHGGGRRS